MDLNKTEEKIQSFLNPLNRVGLYGNHGLWGTLCNRSSYSQTYLHETNPLISAIIAMQENRLESEEEVPKEIPKKLPKEVPKTEVKSVTTQTEEPEEPETKTTGTQYNKSDVDECEWIVVKNKEI